MLTITTERAASGRVYSREVLTRATIDDLKRLGPEERAGFAVYIKTSLVNATQGHRFSDSGWEESGENGNETGALYRYLLGEWGRCTGKLYRDGPDGTKHVGWVFRSRQKYTDDDETYIREAWVSAEGRKVESEDGG